MVAERVTELLCQVRFRPEESIVLVGHSHYFRELLKLTLDANATLHGASDAIGALHKKKLSNGGVAKLQVSAGKHPIGAPPRAVAAVSTQPLRPSPPILGHHPLPSPPMSVASAARFRAREAGRERRAPLRHPARLVISP